MPPLYQLRRNESHAGKSFRYVSTRTISRNLMYSPASRTRLELHRLPILCWSTHGVYPEVPAATGGYRMLERESARSTTALEISSLSSLPFPQRTRMTRRRLWGSRPVPSSMAAKRISCWLLADQLFFYSPRSMARLLGGTPTSPLRKALRRPRPTLSPWLKPPRDQPTLALLPLLSTAGVTSMRRTSPKGAWMFSTTRSKA
jgi:hypothetical protein